MRWVMNEVRPSTKMLITTPTMIWSTRYRIASTASTQAKATPVSMAATIAQNEPKDDPTMAATNAPPSNMPSMAMLTTATRSDITPASAPRAIGTDRFTVSSSIPASENDLPAAAQVRKANTTRIRATESTTWSNRLNPRVNWTVPTNPSI